jgi:phytoene synthase
MSLGLQPTWEAVLLDRAHTALAAHQPAERRPAPREESVYASSALEAAYETCDLLTRHHSKTFFIASGLLPFEKRRAVRALYAFCRVTDDLVDMTAQTDERNRALDAWRALLRDPAPPPSEPVALAWADARARYDIPEGYADQLIDGVARDIGQTAYETFDDLASYAYGVASTVGLMAMHIIGYAGEHAIPYAVKLGVALQITNILRDVGEDLNNGRIYLPREELLTFGLDHADLVERADRRTDARWARFMTFQIERNRRLYDEALPGVALLSPEGRFAIMAAADLYRAILGDIEGHGYDVFSRRAHLSAGQKLSRMPGIWWRARSVQVMADDPA